MKWNTSLFEAKWCLFTNFLSRCTVHIWYLKIYYWFLEHLVFGTSYAQNRIINDMHVRTLLTNDNWPRSKQNVADGVLPTHTRKPYCFVSNTCDVLYINMNNYLNSLIFILYLIEWLWISCTFKYKLILVRSC